MQHLIRTIRRFAEFGRRDPSSDDQLLERFFVGREADAFAEIVQRHGPTVMGVCQRVLRQPQDAEDAFQATFLTLVRKGHTIRHRGAVASWLYRVAYRISLRQRQRSDERGATERLDDVAIDCDPVDAAGRRELLPVIDRELQRLPEKYRTPMILCFLEGKTYDEAAERIGCPKGTVGIRLLRGREMLKRRLVRCGLMAAAGLALHEVLPRALAAVPAPLAATTSTSAAALACGAALPSVAPVSVAVLVESATRDLWIEKSRVLVLALVALGLTGSGASIGSQVVGLDPIPVPPSAVVAPVRGQDVVTPAPALPVAPAAPRQRLGGTTFVGPGMILRGEPPIGPAQSIGGQRAVPVQRSGQQRANGPAGARVWIPAAGGG